MRYVVARFNLNQRETAYRVYVTDALMILTKNTAIHSGSKYFNVRFCDSLKPQHIQTRSAQDIAKDIIKKAGLEVVN